MHELQFPALLTLEDKWPLSQSTNREPRIISTRTHTNKKTNKINPTYNKKLRQHIITLNGQSNSISKQRYHQFRTTRPQNTTSLHTADHISSSRPVRRGYLADNITSSTALLSDNAPSGVTAVCCSSIAYALVCVNRCFNVS